MAQEYDITIERRPFLLHPEIPPEGMVREVRPGEEDGQLREPLRSRAVDEGLVMRRAARTPYTLPSLEATEYAREKGLDEAFFNNTMKTFWAEGVDLGELDVLERLAEESGLDWGELRPLLESGHYRARVLEQHQEAVGMGIQGIPAFLIGNLLFTGAQPYPVFQKVMQRVLAQ